MKRTALALVVLLALAGCATFSATPGSTPGSDISTPAVPTPVDCGTVPQEPDAPERLEHGIARITLCNDPAHSARFDVPGLTVPPDALVLDADRVADAYNAAADLPRTGEMACNADLGPAYRLVVEYPDGARVQLSGELFGCRVVGAKVGAQDVFDAFTTALRAQRTTLPAPVIDPDPDAVCRRNGQSWLPARLADTSQGVLCTGFDDEARGAPIAPEDWAIVRDDMLAHARPWSEEDLPAECPPRSATSLVGVTPAGETFLALPGCTAWSWSPEDPDPSANVSVATVWEPGPEAAAILERSAG